MHADNELPLVEHLVELRSRLIRSLVALVLAAAVMLPFAQNIYAALAHPLVAALPAGTHMIATEVTAPFFVPLKVTLMVAFLVTLPYTLYQLWAFVAPALYRHERRLILPLLVSSFVLFAVGMAFAFFVVFPIVFVYLSKAAPAGVAMATDIDKYVSFVLRMFLAFGMTFEVPVVVVVLFYLGVVSLAQLKAARPYVIVGAFVVGGVLAPPDMISQILMAVPLLILYEGAIVVCGWIKARPKNATAEALAVVDNNASGTGASSSES